MLAPSQVQTAGVGNAHIPDIAASQVLGNRQQLFSEDDIRRMSADEGPTGAFTNAHGDDAHLQAVVTTAAVPPPSPHVQEEPDVIQVQPQPSAVPAPAAAPAPAPAPQSPKKNKTLIIVSSIVLAAVVIVGGALLLRSVQKKKLKGGDSFSALHDVLENGGRSAVFSELS